MADLRAAAQQALEALGFSCPAPNLMNKHKAAEDSLRAALAQQEQKPKAWMLTDDSGMRFVSVDRPHPDFVPLYTHPPRREWRSLSEEEINELSHTMVKGHKSVNWLARAIEAALKERNT